MWGPMAATAESPVKAYWGLGTWEGDGSNSRVASGGLTGMGAADGGYSRVASGMGAADGGNTRLSLTSCVVSAVDGRTVSRPLPIVYMCSDRHN